MMGRISLLQSSSGPKRYNLHYMKLHRTHLAVQVKKFTDQQFLRNILLALWIWAKNIDIFVDSLNITDWNLVKIIYKLQADSRLNYSQSVGFRLCELKFDPKSYGSPDFTSLKCEEWWIIFNPFTDKLVALGAPFIPFISASFRCTLYPLPSPSVLHFRDI